MNSPDAFLYPSSLSDPVKGHCLRQTSCSRQRRPIQIPRLLFIPLFLLQGLLYLLWFDLPSFFS